MDRVADLVESTQPTSLLDAGCGEGFAVDRLAQRLPDVKITGVDLSPEAIAYAQAHFGERARFRTGSVYKLPFSDRAFDTVLCSEVLEHVDDPSTAIRELKRVARNYVIITVPLEPYFQWLNVLGQKLGLSLDPGHVNFWTKKAFMKFMRYHFEEPEFAWKHIYQFMKARV
jgi:ubiquinone/menaquinone biosynthesis C-methylase UbiE